MSLMCFRKLFAKGLPRVPPHPIVVESFDAWETQASVRSIFEDEGKIYTWIDCSGIEAGKELLQMILHALVPGETDQEREEMGGDAGEEGIEERDAEKTVKKKVGRKRRRPKTGRKRLLD